jgi:hypothetical protein
MNRLLPAVATVLMLALSTGARASAEGLPCAAPVLALLAKQLQVDHFVPGRNAFGSDPAGVILSTTCKRMPSDPRLTLAAVAWDAGRTDSKSLVLAIVDEASAAVVASMKDEIYEDAWTPPPTCWRPARARSGWTSPATTLAAATTAWGPGARSMCATAQACARWSPACS